MCICEVMQYDKFTFSILDFCQNKLPYTYRNNIFNYELFDFANSSKSTLGLTQNIDSRSKNVLSKGVTRRQIFQILAIVADVRPLVSVEPET